MHGPAASPGIDYEALVRNAPFPTLLMSPALVILDANDAYLRATGRARDELVGRPLFEAFPAAAGEAGEAGVRAMRASLARVAASRQPDHVAVVQYDIPMQSAGTTGFETRFWSVIHTPILDARGELAGLCQNPIDVTAIVQARPEGPPLASDMQYLIAGSVFSRVEALETSNRLLGQEHERLLALFRQAPGFVAILNGPAHVVDMVNEAYYELVGRRELIGKPMVEALPELRGQGYGPLLDRVYREGQAFVGRQMRLELRDVATGQPIERYIDFVYQPITDSAGQTVGIFLQGHDVTEQKRAQDALRASNERWELAVEGAGDGVWDWNIESGDVVYSRRFRQMFGYSDAQFLNRFDAWSSRVHPEDLKGVLDAMEGAVHLRKPLSVEYRFLCADGSWRWVQTRGQVHGYQRGGKPARMTGTITDISDKRASEEKIWREANFDPLTGLPNRRLFRDRLEQEIRKAQRSHLSLALMFLDLDRFKEVNDMHGHDAGDRLLVEAAQRLSHCVRASDTVARLGGDEFTVILTELTDMTHVERVARKILQALASPFHFQQQAAFVTGSIGITIYDADATNAEQLIANADQAMYAAKNAGRNQFCYFTPSMQERALRRLSLAHELRHAVQAGQLEVVYQPVLSLASGEVVKAEALLRWHHPELGNVEPAQFIPIAEESGLINDIGDWVFCQAVEATRLWHDGSASRLQVSVNASPVQLQAGEGGLSWPGYIRHRGLLGERIALEITEGVLLNATPQVAERLQACHEAGIELAIDDFGTGYSSMQYLKKFDIDYLKIDQSFVRDMVNDPSDRTIVRSIIVMAHELGLRVIAEGIETEEQRALLAQAGCDFGQGYLFSPPLPGKDFAALLARGQAGVTGQRAQP